MHSYTKYSARDFSKPLTSSERLQIKESILGWIDQTVALICKRQMENGNYIKTTVYSYIGCYH